MMLMKPDLFDTMFATFDRRSTFTPAFDVSETDQAIVLEADLPGMTDQDVKVMIHEGVLTVSGEKKFESETKEKNYHRVERRYGSFSRAFTLPETVNVEKVEARVKNGVLTVSLPKTEAAKPKTIDVKVK